MAVFILKRFGLALLVALTVSFISFSLLFMAGDPAVAIAGENASSEDIAVVNERYGFDRPMIVQYGDWLGSAVTGDLGNSWYFDMPVTELIADRLTVTMKLGLFAITLALAVAILLAAAAANPNSMIDRFALFLSVVGQAIPSFWFGLILIVIFSIKMRLLPASGNETWQHFVLPTVVLGYYATPRSCA